MLQAVDYQNENEMKQLLQSRSSEIDPEIIVQVTNIIEQVKSEGDQAVKKFTQQFDSVWLDDYIVSQEEIDTAVKSVDPFLMENFREAKQNIEKFHIPQKAKGFELTQEDGVYLGQRVLPLDKVGIYVPGGKAAYPSSVLMNVIPAKIAGVNDIIMVTPPDRQGQVNPVILAAAAVAGVDRIYKVGGAQAIAALAYGTKTIPKVDKIVGPGNIYVSVAKKLVFGLVDIDMIAGPSEILVIADEAVEASYAAADLLSQAEHDPLASSILIALSDEKIAAVTKEIKKQLAELPKKEIASASLKNYGYSLKVSSIEEAIEVSNRIAPEHLELLVNQPKNYLPLIKNAGSIFLGYDSCESIGDYFGGTNHVLPTNGTARFYSSLGVESFVKRSSYLHWTPEALEKHGDKIINMALSEGLQGHARAVEVRRETYE
ncbi:histidinol dehydrogenase [Vagococcus elongatus]|uniref:Histidinol dehydrogenase n=1 Tax=Vagococcus elongatus TaxID=180344 RepID=A0A430ALS1_9ENTE|nr:histidinol dehydrogenase [Vagococcus elongatus]RSU09071.1 histidinol dehydrogenase [Vagococcus elongatus]